MNEPTVNFTDTDRMDWIAEMDERTNGRPAAEFRPQLDERILADRAARAPEVIQWTDIAEDFPLDHQAVHVLASDEVTGVACFDSEALDWFVHRPGHVSQGKRWSEAHGRNSVVVKWRK